MSDTRKTFSLLFVAWAAVAWAGYRAAAASAQERGPTASPHRPERRPRAGGGRCGQPPGGERRPGLRLGHFPGGHLFRPLPEDQGPLTPDEQRELVSFLRKHAPNMHLRLREIRARDPAAFDEHLQDAAPRLRVLRRIFARDPQLGRNVLRHAENLRRIHRARRAWRKSEPDPQARRRIYAAIRRMTAENVRIETAVLDDQALELERQRDGRIEAEFERLVSADADLAEEPPEVRELVERLQAAQEDEDLEWLYDKLRQICSERMDREVARLRNRAERLRTNAVGEVDRRLQRLTRLDEREPGDYARPKRNGDRQGNEGRKRGRPPGRRP